MSYPVYIDVTENSKIEIPLREVKRCLGYGRVEMTPEIADLALSLIDETRKIMRPRACYTRLAVTFMDYPRMDFGFGIVESKNLWRNLTDGSLSDFTAPAGAASSGETGSDASASGNSSVSDGSAPGDPPVSRGSVPGDLPLSRGSVPGNLPLSRGSDPGDSSECFLLAATIGPQMDVLIRRYARTSPSKSVILQAIGAAAIEAYCDLLERRIAGEVSGEGLTLLPRFSPGYGDFSLQHQRDFFRVLDPPRRAGITLTDQLLMVPEKSVTAVIGLSKAGASCHTNGAASKTRCEVCSNEACDYRIFQFYRETLSCQNAQRF